VGTAMMMIPDIILASRVIDSPLPQWVGCDLS
jgi:hypothetical protein